MRYGDRRGPNFRRFTQGAELTMKVCAIHQSNFFPWLGYFDKIKRVDIFVFLNQVNYPKSGNSMSSWCNRVKIMIDGKPDWVSCPVVRESGIQSIESVRIDSGSPWRDKIRKVIEANYKGAPDKSSRMGGREACLRS